MKNMWLMMILALVLVSGTQTVSAEEQAPMTPFMLGWFNPAQAPSAKWDVCGLRLDVFYGKCRNLTGLDAGVLVNHATEDVIGLEACFVVNYVERDFSGLQIGTVNVVGRQANALQIGFYNGAEDMSGLQIGVVNRTRLMRGCQIGVVNVIENSDIPFLPVINFLF
jgi:hypothetical protein